MREEQPCRHGGCNKQFSSVTTRNEHERSVSHCCVGDCPACKEKEERNEQEEQNQQERGRKRKEWEDETERCCESEEVVVNAIKHQRRAAYEEYHLKGVPNQDQRLHDLAVVALQAIYSMPKVLLSLCSTAKPFTHTSHGLQLKLC